MSGHGAGRPLRPHDVPQVPAQRAAPGRTLAWCGSGGVIGTGQVLPPYSFLLAEAAPAALLPAIRQLAEIRKPGKRDRLRGADPTVRLVVPAIAGKDAHIRTHDEFMAAVWAFGDALRAAMDPTAPPATSDTDARVA